MLRIGAFRARPAGGFSLAELMTVVALMSLLVLAAIPSLATWTRNVKVRSAADELQNALRMARTEAVRRSRQVVFMRTKSAAASVSALSAAADGTHWAVVSLPLLDDEGTALIEVGDITDTASGFSISGASALCFNSSGRLVANARLPFTGACEADSGLTRFKLDMKGADKPLQVVVAAGGKASLCDPARTLSAGAPQGCP